MGDKFRVCARVVRGWGPSYAFIALLRCIEDMARMTGERFTHICRRLGIGLTPGRWPGLEEMRAALDVLEAERAARLGELQALRAARRRAKRAWRLEGGPRPAPGRLEELERGHGGFPVPRVGVWGWRKRRERAQGQVKPDRPTGGGR